MLQTKNPQFGDTGDEIDLSDIARSLRRQWRTIVGAAIAATLVALFVVLLSQPIFLVNGSLYFGDVQSAGTFQGQNNISLLNNFQSVNDVPTEVALIQSRSLIEKAILETGLNVTVHGPQSRIPNSFWQWRFEDGKAIDAYEPRPGDLSVHYATLFDPGTNGAEFNLKFGNNGAYTLYSIADPKTVVLSGTLKNAAAGKGVTMLVTQAVDGPPPASGSVYTLKIVPAKALADTLISGLLTVTQGGSVTIPTLTADIKLLWHNPYQGQAFINQLMSDFIATQLAWKTESASDTEQFVSQQLDNIRASLADADSKLAAYKADTGIVDVPANSQSVVNELSQYQVQRSTAALQQQALQQLVLSTSGSKSQLNPYLVTQVNDPVLQRLAGDLADAQIKLQTQSAQFTAASPEIQQQQATIAKTESAIRSLLRNDEALAAGNLANIDHMIATYQSQLKSMPSQSLQIIELTRSSDVYGQLYVLLMQNEEQAEVSKAATIVDTRIVSQAEVPLFSTKPKAAITVLAGMILGLLAGVMIVLVQRVLSGRYHSEGDVRRTISLPILGLIPSRGTLETVANVFPDQKQKAFSEAFRLLRSRVYQAFSGGDAIAKVILVTSAASNDGKTTIAANLAKSIADDGKRVVLIDGDLHRGHLHEALKIQQKPGLSEWLSGKQGARPQLVAGQKFSALAAGAYSLSAADALKDSSLAIVFNTLKQEFDYIIVDCPPLPSVVDTVTFSKFADLILSVIYIERTSRSAFNSHYDALSGLEIRHGLVINGLLSGSHYQQSAYGEPLAANTGLRRYIPFLR